MLPTDGPAHAAAGERSLCTMLRFVTMAGLIAAGVLVQNPAVADDSNRALAQSLFVEARKLAAAGRVGEACPKFAESQRLGPAPGTLLNLAVCHEREGKLATAWEEFLQVQAEARRDRRPDREKIAADHLGTIQPRLPWLTVTVAESARTEGVQVLVDGIALDSASWGVASPVNPGDHLVTASLAGKRDHLHRFRIAEGERREIEIPRLVDAIGSTSPAPLAGAAGPVPDAVPGSRRARASSERGFNSSGQRTAGYVAGAMGLVGVGVGTIFGLRAMSQWNDSNDQCPNGACTPDGAHLSHEAGKAARIADVGFGIGLLGLGLGTVLILTSPARDATSVRAYVLPTGAGGLSASVPW